MSDLTDLFDDAVARMKAAFQSEYTDYSGTMSYFEDKRDDEIADLVQQGVTVIPNPDGLPPTGDFFATAGDFLEGALADYSSALVGIQVNQVIGVLDSTTPPNPTFGQLMGRLISGDTSVIFGSPAEASLAAKAIANYGLSIAAFGSAIDVIEADQHLTQAGKESWTLAGTILGGELGGKLLAPFGPYWAAGGMVIGGGLGGLFFPDFYDNYLDTILDDAMAQNLTAAQIEQFVSDAARDYVDELWAKTGAEALNLWDAIVDGMTGFLDDLPHLAQDYDWAPPTLPDFVPEAFTPFDAAKTLISPLVLDLDGDGIELTSFNTLTTTTFFDIDTDGFAEQTAWVGADDGLLAIDINENGKIDNASELFGTATVDGFAKLAELDSNGDLIIDASDATWNDLVIWKDADSDAATDAGELASLSTQNRHPMTTTPAKISM